MNKDINLKKISSGSDSTFYKVSDNEGLLITYKSHDTQFCKLVMSIYTHITNGETFIKSFNIYNDGSTGIVLEVFDKIYCEYLAEEHHDYDDMSWLEQEDLVCVWIGDNEPELDKMSKFFEIHLDYFNLNDIHDENIALYKGEYILFDGVFGYSSDEGKAIKDMIDKCKEFEITINDYRVVKAKH